MKCVATVAVDKDGRWNVAGYGGAKDHPDNDGSGFVLDGLDGDCDVYRLVRVEFDLDLEKLFPEYQAVGRIVEDDDGR